METTLNSLSTMKPDPSAEEVAAKELVRLAREQGLSLTGPDGLLKLFTKNVLETALNEEMTGHLGHEKNRAAAGRESANVRNGTRPKTVLTGTSGTVDLEVPRDRDGTFEPVIVRKRQRRLGEVDEIVLLLFARGLTTGEISAHFAQIYGASVSKETVSRVTDKVLEEMTTWQEGVYATISIDAIVVKVRDGQVANRPVYAAIGVNLAGDKDVLGLWTGTRGEGTKFWMSVLTDLRNRGVKDTLFVVCDGLKGAAGGRRERVELEAGEAGQRRAAPGQLDLRPAPRRLAPVASQYCASLNPRKGFPMTVSHRNADFITVFECGLTTIDDGSAWFPWEGTRTLTLSTPAYLIGHGSDLLLWETGIDDDVAQDPGGRVVAPGVRTALETTLAEQFTSVGSSFEDVTVLGLSHGHVEHAGNARRFPGAKWYVQGAEHTAMFEPGAASQGFVPELVTPLRNNDTVLLDGDLDLFGDGSVMILSTPGHTLGHQSLLVRLPGAGTIIIGGDVAHSWANLRHRRVPTISADADAAARSMERIADLVDAENAQLWLGHDVGQSATLRRAPERIR